MQRIIIAAAVLLILQIGLVFYTNSTNLKYEAFSPGGHLFTFSPDSVSSIKITDGSKKELTLQKENGNWQLEMQARPPAAEKLVKQLLEKLAGLKESLAVATTRGAAKRFKVSKDVFENHVVIKKGDENLVDLYVGTSPGFRHIHARVAGQDNIYSLPLSSAELSASAENWVDKEMLHVNEEDLQQIDMATFSIVKNDREWTLTNIEENMQIKTEEVKQLVTKLAGLNIQTVLTEDEIPAIDTSEPEFEYSLILKDKGTITYTFNKVDEGDYILRVSDQALSFKVKEWIVNEIRDISKESIVESAEVAE